MTLPSVDRNCLSHDIAIERAKNQLKMLVNSPNTRLVDEYTALVRKEFSIIERFIINNEVPSEDIGTLYDCLKAKYGIDPTADLNRIVSDKLQIIVQAGRELNICPCCNGSKMHTIPEGESANSKNIYQEEGYACQTCKGTGRLA